MSENCRDQLGMPLYLQLPTLITDQRSGRGKQLIGVQPLLESYIRDFDSHRPAATANATPCLGAPLDSYLHSLLLRGTT